MLEYLFILYLVSQLSMIVTLNSIFQMLRSFYSCVCCEPRPIFPNPYLFNFGSDASQTISNIFQTNQIKTTKFNIFNFLPKSIISQYQRLANFYFLIIAIISIIPDATPLNPVLIWIPLLFVLSISVIKQLYEDYRRYKTDKEVNEIKESSVIRDHKLQKIKWKEIIVGDICKIQEEEMFPADLLIISSSDQNGVAYIETASLDGEQTSKIRYAFEQLKKYTDQNMDQLKGSFEGEIPNPSLTQFRGILEADNNKLSIDSSQLLYRGTKLKNTSWIYGVVVYTGQCSKIMMNGQSFVSKFSGLQKKLNYLLIVMLITQIFTCVIIAALSTTLQFQMRETQTYLIWRNYSKSRLFIYNCLLFFVEYSSLIPVSLILSIEIAKTAQSYFIDFDQLMYSKWRKRKTNAKTAILNEQLGQVQYIFCDKTGTLTKNQLKFHTAIIGNQRFQFKFNSESKSYTDDSFTTIIERRTKETEALQKQLILQSANRNVQINDYARLIEEYLMCLLVCNNINTIQDDNKGLKYESQSPDELALIQLAKSVGFIFLKRDKNSILVKIANQIHKIDVIERFSFTSDRKRMSVIIRWRDEYFLYAKGADNVILQRAKSSPFNIIQSVDRLSLEGLRSLLLAIRLLSQKQVMQFLQDLNSASVEQRDCLKDQYAAHFQKDLTILGATGLLDELQSDVPQTLRDFQRAQIRVWMLTGDKLQTAIEIGKACGLIQPTYEVILLRSNCQSITEFIEHCATKVANTRKKYSLVVEGSMLTQIFNNDQVEASFAEVAHLFASVICCRMLPVQKSLAVKMVKQRLKKVCLAVGDGGNDVSMIKQANIGVGVYGEQGMNAVQASDYAIPEFKMLWRLLFVHGRWNYMRISEMVLYFTYKSIIFSVPRFLFSFKNAYSGQSVYDDYYIALYNVVFTALPLLVRALFEQDVNYVRKMQEVEDPERQNREQNSQMAQLPSGFTINFGMRKLFPKIYFVGQKNQIFNLKECLIWFIQAILISVCLFFVTQRVLGSESINQNGYNGNLRLVSITVYTTVIMLDTIKLSMQVRHWTLLLFFTILFLSLAPYLAFIWVLNYRFKRPIEGVLNIYFTSMKTYFIVLLLIMILVAINGIMIYIRFHSHQILKKMTIALQKDTDMLSYIQQSQVIEPRQVDSEDQLKIMPCKSNIIIINEVIRKQ